MGKRSSRGNYTSKGERSNIAKSTLKSVSREVLYVDRELDLIKQWRKGKNPWITVPNSNKKETAKRWIKVRANDHYGDPKGRRNTRDEDANLQQR